MYLQQDLMKQHNYKSKYEENAKDKFISKTLSWILRHGALKEGLTIDNEGFVDIQSILKSRSLINKCTVDDIQRVVHFNLKQRFSIRQNPTTKTLEIKANQGHSIDTVTCLNLTPITQANKYPVVVHGTYLKNWDNIRLHGLNRMKRLHIHFAYDIPKNKTVQSGIRNNCEVYIYINLEKALADAIQFYESPNQVILSPGDENGFIKPIYFLKVISASNGVQIYP